jgi:hypothetical protein
MLSGKVKLLRRQNDVWELRREHRDDVRAAEEAYNVRALEAKKSKVTAETTLLEAPAVEITKTD